MSAAPKKLPFDEAYAALLDIPDYIHEQILSLAKFKLKDGRTVLLQMKITADDHEISWYKKWKPEPKS